MSKSVKMSRGFYNSIGAKGLSARTRKEWDKQILKDVEAHLSKQYRILDVGCGYGRITVPLAKKGYHIEGVDLSEKLIKDAKAYAKKEKFSIHFKVGNMCRLPYEKESFDAILCLWSAFNELLTMKEQLQAIKNMMRVLKKGGFALFEGGLYENPDDRFYGSGKRIKKDVINGIRNDHYNHDTKSFKNLFKRAGIKKYKIWIGKWGGRDRLLVKFYK